MEVSVISIALEIILRRRIKQSQATLKKLEMEASNMKKDARGDGVGKYD